MGGKTKEAARLLIRGIGASQGQTGGVLGITYKPREEMAKQSRQADREHTKQAGRLGLLTTGDMGKDISREARQRGQVATAAGKSDTAGHEDTHPPTSKSNSYAQKRGAAQQRSWGHIAAHAVQGFCNPLAVALTCWHTRPAVHPTAPITHGAGGHATPSWPTAGALRAPHDMPQRRAAAAGRAGCSGRSVPGSRAATRQGAARGTAATAGAPRRRWRPAIGRHGGGMAPAPGGKRSSSARPGAFHPRHCSLPSFVGKCASSMARPPEQGAAGLQTST